MVTCQVLFSWQIPRRYAPRNYRAPETQREIRRKASAAKYALRLRGCAANFVNARKLLMPMTFARRTAEENARATSLRMTLCAHGGLVMTTSSWRAKNRTLKTGGCGTRACAFAPAASARATKARLLKPTLHAAEVLLRGGSAALCVDAADENSGKSPSGNVG
jgi:hypothetical protein